MSGLTALNTKYVCHLLGRYDGLFQRAVRQPNAAFVPCRVVRTKLPGIFEDDWDVEMPGQGDPLADTR